MKKILTACFFASLLVGFASCSKSVGGDPVYEAVVTVKTASDQSCYFQLDDETALKPTNDIFKKNPYGKEVRAHMIYTDKGRIEEVLGYTWRKVSVSAIDTILTKQPVAPGLYGSAPIEIYNSWMTCMEDGYLTLYFEGLFGTSGIVHRVNLVKTDEPLVFTLAHDDCGDTGIIRRSGLIAFDMHSMPVPNSSEFDVFINYTGYTQEKTLILHYKDGKYTISSLKDLIYE